MMSLPARLQRILAEPSPEDIWQLQPWLLNWQQPAAMSAHELARGFYCYLNTVRSKLTSKQYSALAARLAASSIGVIAIEDVLEAMLEERGHTLYNMLAGGLAAVLETLATVQHVQAWQTEFVSVHDEAAWCLYQVLWQLSKESQAALAPDERHELIERLLRPVRDPDMPSMVRMVVIVRLFQLLLVIRLAPLLQYQPGITKEELVGE